MTQTPASGPAGPPTVPPMSLSSIATAAEAVVLGSLPPPQAANNVARHESVNGRGMVRMLVPPVAFGFGRKTRSLRKAVLKLHYPLRRGLCKPAHGGNSLGRRIL